MYHAPPEIELIISGYHGLMERGERQMEKESATARPPHDPIIAVIEPSLKVGVACGTTGFLLGGAAGIIKGTSPFLFASASGIQTFALGTTFWATRSTIVEAWTPANHQLPAGDLTKASTISGGITGGAVALLMRGRANVLPGILMFSIFGFAGQVTSNWLARPRGITDGPPKQSFWRRMSEKAWSPVTVMSDEEYAKMLKEKMLRVDAQLSILDDRMAALRKVQEAQDVASSLPEE